MPMQAIADDSGCKGQGPVLVIAGLLGRSEWWADFSDRWTACLSEPPAIGYFKMYEAAHRSGEFVGLGEAQRDAKLIALARVLNEHPFVALHMTLDLAEHERYFANRQEGGKRTKKRFKAEGIERSAYFYAYNSFISAACFHFWDHGEREQFDFIVDEHPSLGQRAKDWYAVSRTLVKDPMRSIMPASPIPKNDVAFMPLQAADMIAWLQRSANTGEGHKFEWLGQHFTLVRPSERCVYMGDLWFANLRQRIDAKQRPATLPLEAMVELARLQGAPIPGPDSTIPPKEP